AMDVPTEVTRYQCRTEAGRVVVDETHNGRPEATLVLSAAGRVLESVDQESGLRRRAMRNGTQVMLMADNIRTGDSRVVGTVTTNPSGSRILSFSDAAGRSLDVARTGGQIRRVDSSGGSLALLADERGRPSGEAMTLAQTPDQSVTMRRALDGCGNVVEGSTSVG